MHATPRSAGESIAGHFIAGSRVDGTGARQPIFNPATGVVTRHVTLATPDEVQRAVASAQAAFRRGPTRRRSAVRACCSDFLNC